MNTEDFETVSRHDYEAVLERAEKSEADLERVTTEAYGERAELLKARSVIAEMRVAILSLRIELSKRMPMADPEEIPAWLESEHAISSDAGRDFFHRDEFKILVEALREIEAHPDARHQIVQVCKRTIAAAHEKGIIS